MKSKTVWITGTGGLLGNALVMEIRRVALDWTVIPLNRACLELTDLSSVERRFHLESPGCVLHAAAMSKSPACQENPKRAWRENVDATRHLADLTASAGVHMLFFSTDLVFDGTSAPYAENARRNPLNVYGETKVAAEDAVLRHPGHCVVRTSLNFGSSPTGDRSFNEEMLKAWKSGRTLDLFTDEHRCPIAATETARITWRLMQAGATGVFHVAGAERLSRWDLGEALIDYYRRMGRSREDGIFSMPVRAGSLKSYRGAPRAPDTTLGCSRAESLLGERMPEFRNWLSNQIPKERSG